MHQNSELYGADRVLIDVAAVLARSAEVLVVVPRDGPLVGELERRGVRTEVLPTIFVLRKETLHPRNWLRGATSAITSTWALRALVRRFGATRVYVNTITLPTAVLAARLARRPVIVHVHEAEPGTARPVQLALLAPLLLATRLIVISDAVGSFVSGSWPALARRTYVARNPTRFPQPDFVPLPAERPDRIEVISVGRWSPRKGTDLAILACARARELGVGLHLTLVGSAFAGYEWFETQVREQAARDLSDTAFVSFVADPDEFWRRAHVTLVPSRIEPYGLVAAESMVRGRVTIASDVGGLHEIVTDGRTGLLVGAHATELARALHSVWTDWMTGTALAEHGRAAAANWTFEAFATRLEQVTNLDHEPVTRL